MSLKIELSNTEILSTPVLFCDASIPNNRLSRGNSELMMIVMAQQHVQTAVRIEEGDEMRNEENGQKGEH
jgi:hypothetical protein